MYYVCITLVDEEVVEIGFQDVARRVSTFLILRSQFSIFFRTFAPDF